MALKPAHRAYIIEFGSISLEGDARDLADNESVRRAYLGGQVRYSIGGLLLGDRGFFIPIR